MDDPERTFLLLLLAVSLIVLNGFFVAIEHAVSKLRAPRAKELKDAGHTSARYLSSALKDLDAYLAATQLGITLSSLGLGWTAALLALHHVLPALRALGMGDTPALALAALCVLFVFVVAHALFGGLVPRAFALRRSEAAALQLARPMAAVFALFRPAALLLHGASRLVQRALGLPPANGNEAHTEEELRLMLTANGNGHGEESEEEKAQVELLDNVFDFGKRLARQVMVHRTEILMLDVEAPLEDNVRLAQESGHTRYPVFHDDMDTVIGFVHSKDLISLYQREPRGDLRAVVREILIVPETIRVAGLLRQLQQRRQHMALLVDEYGGTAGLVTIADLLEELVGELPDEFEPVEEEWLLATGEHTWSVDGRMPLDELCEAIDRQLPCDEVCDTVGGYVFWAFGRIPEVGDTAEKDHHVALRVLAMDARRVSRVELTMLPHDEEDDEDDSLHNGRVLSAR